MNVLETRIEWLLQQVDGAEDPFGFLMMARGMIEAGALVGLLGATQVAEYDLIIEGSLALESLSAGEPHERLVTETPFDFGPTFEGTLSKERGKPEV